MQVAEANASSAAQSLALEGAHVGLRAYDLGFTESQPTHAGGGRQCIGGAVSGPGGRVFRVKGISLR